jgi:hypothetical protein
MTSARTKSALAAAKARGVRLGNPHLKPGTREQALAANRGVWQTLQYLHRLVWRSAINADTNCNFIRRKH